MSDSTVAYLLRLGDTALISGQRLGEWCGHGPILEEDIALTNIALDQIGQARLLLSEAGKREGKGRSEDDLAFQRDVDEFGNLLMAELPNGDFGQTILRMFLLSAQQFMYYRALLDSKDEMLRAFSAKSIKEVQYHLHHSRDWVIRLGDGTAESKKRMQEALELLWPYTGEFFLADDLEKQLATEGIAPDTSEMDSEWLSLVTTVLNEAKLSIPDVERYQKGGKQGRHSEHLGFILAEMQWLPRAHPEAQW